MGRPLTGTRKQTAAGYRCELPTTKGSKDRSRYTFRTASAGDAWLADGIEALNAGRPLPTPHADDVVLDGGRVSRGTGFRCMATLWHREQYAELWRGDADRAATVQRHIDVIDQWMNAHGLALEGMARKHVHDMFLSFARAEAPANPQVPAGLDRDRLVTMDQAAALPGVPSRSTLKRRQKEGLLVAHRQPDGRVLYRIADLYSSEVGGGTPGGLRRGPRRSHGYSQGVLQDLKWVFEQVCAFARDHGVAVPTDRDSLRLPRSDRPATPERKPVPLDVCATIAVRLHAVHQVALWLMRILGLRISEAFGIRVADVHDLGEGHPGIVVIRRQGGRTFQKRNRQTDAVELTDSVEGGKTKNSYRVLVVPTALMDLLRVVITVFHTGPDGSRRQEARLIPGLVKDDRSGQAAFRTALREASAAVGVRLSGAPGDEEDETFSCTSHDLRKAAISELSWRDIDLAWRKRWAGHAAGDDVHHRHYVLDDPKLRPGRDIAEIIQQSLDDELCGNLAIPTTVRCTTRNQPALAADADRIDAELAARRWLVLPGVDGQALLNAADVARELCVSVQVARRWMESGRLPSVDYAPRARGIERRARLADVMRMREGMRRFATLPAPAEELGQTYHTVYQYVRAQSLELVRVGERTYGVPPETESVIRKHYAEQATLHARAVKLSVAATMLGTKVEVILHHLREGDLLEDDRAHDGSRMVSRASVAALEQRRGKRPRVAAGKADDVVPWSEACARVDMSSNELAALIASGRIEMARAGRGKAVTRASLLQYMVATDASLVTFAAAE
jgi:integrase